MLWSSLSGHIGEHPFRCPAALQAAFESGDQIEVQGQTGTVEAITIRETRIETFHGQLVVIPNRDVYKNVTGVPTDYGDCRISFVTGVSYENDAPEACAVSEEALRSVAGVANQRPCEALVTDLGVSTLNIEARFWAGPAQHESWVVLDEAIKTVKTARVEMPADIIALQATPSFRAALHNDGEVTPGGSVKAVEPT